MKLSEVLDVIIVVGHAEGWTSGISYKKRSSGVCQSSDMKAELLK